MLKSCFFSGLTIFCICGSPAQTFTVTYGFPNVATNTGTVDPGPSPIVTGLSLGTFSAVGLGANPNASGRFSFTGWPVGATNGEDNYGNYTAALSPFSYYELAIGILPGYTLELQSIKFDVRRSGTGIRNYCVRSDLDNYTSNLAASTGTNTKLEVIPNDVFFWKYDSSSTSNDQKGSVVSPGPAFSDLTQTLYLRFYSWNSESSGGSFSIDNVNLTGRLKDSTLLAGFTGPDWKQEFPFRTIYFPVAAELDLVALANCGQLEMFDAAGRLIFQQRSLNSLEPIKLKNIIPGIYHIRTVCNGQQIVLKLALF